METRRENHVTDYRQLRASGFHDIPAVLYLSLFVLQEKPLLQQYNTHQLIATNVCMYTVSHPNDDIYRLAS
jgi:hypothetical protein